jgi:hypothetical protein
LLLAVPEADSLQLLVEPDQMALPQAVVAQPQQRHLLEEHRAH